ncbi:MAG: VOC family protein [Knoellia sp.]
MALLWYSVVVDCHDIGAQARWWAETLDWKVGFENDEEVVIAPHNATEDVVETLEEWRRRSQELVFVPVAEGKSVKNRLHIDLAPHTSQDRDVEIAALLERGATRVDVGQTGDATWTVLADPEGNEFCVLSARDR